MYACFPVSNTLVCMSSSDLVSLVEAELPDVLHVSQIQARSDDDVEGLRYVAILIHRRPVSRGRL